MVTVLYTKVAFMSFKSFEITYVAVAIPRALIGDATLLA